MKPHQNVVLCVATTAQQRGAGGWRKIRQEIESDGLAREILNRKKGHLLALVFSDFSILQQSFRLGRYISGFVCSIFFSKPKRRLTSGDFPAL
jgi:hypothetical protein